jgi:THAP domain
MYVCFACRCKIWLVNCRRADLDKFFKSNPNYLYNNCRLCSDHFEHSQFVDPVLKRRLTASAVPTIFNVPAPPQKLCSSRKPPAKRLFTDLVEPVASDASVVEVTGNLCLSALCVL